MDRMFGTDGVRGIANQDFTPEFVFALAKAACRILGGAEKNKKPLFVIAKDTRISGGMIECALASGIMSSGGDVIMAGVVPTPAMGVLISRHHADGGVMISASHNPYYDNGIKFFDAGGFKLADEREDEIQNYVENPPDDDYATHEQIGSYKPISDSQDAYIEFLADSFSFIDINGLHIALDCANGATYSVACRIFEDFGAKTTRFFCDPDGLNINERCGSTSPHGLAQKVVDINADFGLAFDGDGDRIIAVDEKGNIIDGDAIIYLCALYLKDNQKLDKNTVIATVMSNLGLTASLNEKGIEVVRTQVGDRYILKEMLEGGYVFGGEQSGHIIIKDVNTTGDGIACGLLLSHIIKQSGKAFSECLKEYTPSTQFFLNVDVPKEMLGIYQTDQNAVALINEIENKYAESGRVLVRHSGTQPMIRIMIEGEDKGEIISDVNRIAALLRQLAGKNKSG